MTAKATEATPEIHIERQSGWGRALNILVSAKDSFQLNGLRRYGKSTLLRKIESWAKFDSDSPYSLAVLWKMSSDNLPTDVSSFWKILHRLVYQQLQAGKENHDQFDGYLEILELGHISSEDENGLDSLRDSVETLLNHMNEKGDSVLFLWDDVEMAFQASEMPIDLWNRLREKVFHKRIHKVVIASEQSVRELFVGKESQQSRFWELVAKAVKLDAFSVGEMESGLSLAKCSGDLKSISKEIKNSTGGIPALVGLVLNRLRDLEIDVKQLESILCEVGDEYESLLLDIKQSFPKEWDSIIKDLVKEGRISKEGITPRQQRDLTRKGIVVEDGSKLRFTFWMLEPLLESDPSGGLLHRRFGRSDQFHQNFGELLKVRFNSIKFHRVDESAIQFLKSALENPAPNSGDRLVMLDRFIARLSVSMLREEFNGLDHIPKEYFENWKGLNRFNQIDFLDKLKKKSNRLKLLEFENWQRIRVLKVLTGLETDVPRAAEVLSKDTVLLLDMLYESRHRSTHPGDKGPEEELIYTVLFCCVQLCVRLETEIQEGKKRR